MPFDGCFLKQTVRELEEAIDTHIDKIYQPSKDELVFLLRKKGFAKRLFICMKPGAARLHFTEEKLENPPAPPMFCMLVRKHLSGGKLLAVTQPGAERVAQLLFSAVNEMGDPVQIRLICEFIGNKTNLLLVGEDGRIIDALRRSDPETGDRFLLPGALYQPPEKQEKADPATHTAAQLAALATAENKDTAAALLDTVEGFSPLICREIAWKQETGVPLQEAIASILQDVNGAGTPTLLMKPNGIPADFTYTAITQYGSDVSLLRCDSYSALLDTFYAEREKADRIHRAAADMIKLVRTLRARTEKKLALRLQELEKCKDRETLRIYGELLKANLYAVKSGAKTVTVPNFYEEMKPITIPLDPTLSPQKNAALYFKEYKKTYTAEQTLTALTAQDREELAYLETVADSIARCESLTDVAEIREELAQAGYLKQAPNKRKKETPSHLKEFVSSEGYRIAVGKNNRQNDLLTTVLAGKNDLWFHTKNIPGSHVVVFCGGNPVSDETLLFAAHLAAAHSKAAGSSNVPVDYTPVKFVKKPAGAKPGMVIYTTNKTLFVTPNGGSAL